MTKNQYKVFPQWGNFAKYPPRIGVIERSEKKIYDILSEIVYLEQNEITPRNIPSATTGDIIEIEGRKYLIEDDFGFSEIILRKVPTPKEEQIEHELYKAAISVDNPNDQQLMRIKEYEEKHGRQ